MAHSITRYTSSVLLIEFKNCWQWSQLKKQDYLAQACTGDSMQYLQKCTAGGSGRPKNKLCWQLLKSSSQSVLTIFHFINTTELINHTNFSLTNQIKDGACFLVNIVNSDEDEMILAVNDSPDIYELALNKLGFVT